MRLIRMLCVVLLVTGFTVSIASMPASANSAHCGTITSNETWLTGESVHILTCTVIVSNGVTLTIPEGAIIKAELGTRLIIAGSLHVSGSALNPVYFTSIRDDTIGGDTNGDGSATTPEWDNWRGIEFQDSSVDSASLIDHAVIRYGGGDYRGNIDLSGASPTITNSILSDGFMAIRADLQSLPFLNGNTYEDNNYNAIGYDGGTIASNTTWGITDTSYFVIGDIFIGVGDTLTIQPGVIVKYDFNRRLVVDGALRVLGTSFTPVYFTSIRDDTVGGDTNGDGSATTPQWHNWRGIEFRDSSMDARSLIDYAVVRYGGGDYRGNINLSSASPTITHSTLSDGHIAIRANLQSVPILRGNTYEDNNYNAIGYDGGTIVTNTIWAITDTSYFIFDDVFVGEGTLLTIRPGVIVKFEISRRLVVDGALRVPGSNISFEHALFLPFLSSRIHLPQQTQESDEKAVEPDIPGINQTYASPAYFTSIRDDTVGGDTNGDGSATTPQWHDWRGIEFRDFSIDSLSLINHAVIRYGGGDYRGNIHLLGASPTISNSTLSDGHIAIRADLQSLPNLSGNTYEDNTYNAIGYDGGTIAPDTTWSNIDTSYFIFDDVFVGDGSTLTIQPGVMVKFEINRRLVVDGALRVLGSASNPVYFTSIRDDTVGGDTNGDGSATTPQWHNWRGIEFRDSSMDGSSIVDNAIIRYGGGDYRGNINLFGASPTITRSSLSDGHIAIRADLQSLPNLSGNSYTENHYNAIGYDGGTIGSDTTWAITDTSYFVIDDIFAGVGATLTVQPGVMVKFEINRRLVVDGALRVLGSASNPVYFTSIRDDTIGGDTNGDGSATIPEWHNWRGIEFRDSSIDAISLVDYAIIRYGGGDYRGGINLFSASPTIQNSTLTKNHRGISAQYSTPVLICNNLQDNIGFGLDNTTPGTLMPAENQWWGSDTGPYHPTTNTTGTGNRVSDGVDYQPWRSSPCGG